VTRAVLLDVEGTTTPIEFVAGVLFPFARRHVAAFLREHAAEAETRAPLRALRAERLGEPVSESAPPWDDAAPVDSALAYALWLMERDRKSTALKALQGRVWEVGYHDGRLRAPVYDDVPPALARWSSEGRRVAIFSSGSVLAQRLLFAHTSAGDLTPWIAAYFDTTSGPKREAASYRRIAGALRLDPCEMLFVSDVVDELDAAREGELATALCVRPGRTQPERPGHAVVASFDGL
jgi:enolase-phosphatase E1